MPNTKSAEKRVRSNARKTTVNRAGKDKIRVAQKKLAALITAGNKAEADKAFAAYSSALDKAAKKKIIHGNKASRKKSRLALRLKNLK
ncbi:MAG: 30S ribosomal protein S20 [Verrucomicrobiota bacterium]|nr:30S ribosomal protein S20 [Verrucomicrobiota bacterium]